MDNNGTIKKMLGSKPKRKRGFGRPKLRWWDSVEQDIRLLSLSLFPVAPHFGAQDIRETLCFTSVS
jgi:hypothetical protein